MDSTKKPFLGMAIKDISRVSDSEVLIEFTDGEKTSLSVWGDCCSDSIFYEIVSPEECRGSEVEDVSERVDGESEDVAMAKIKDSGLFPDFTGQESQSVWDVVFKTKAGEIRIRHCNGSNGYYDGSTEFKKA